MKKTEYPHKVMKTDSGVGCWAWLKKKKKKVHVEMAPLFLRNYFFVVVCIPMNARNVSICTHWPLRTPDSIEKCYPGNAWDPIYNNFDHRDLFLQITLNWVCVDNMSVCASTYVHWMHNRLWSWRYWKAGDKCRNRFIQVTNTSCWRDTLALCTEKITHTSLEIHSYYRLAFATVEVGIFTQQKRRFTQGRPSSRAS